MAAALAASRLGPFAHLAGHPQPAPVAEQEPLADTPNLTEHLAGYYMSLLLAQQQQQAAQLPRAQPHVAAFAPPTGHPDPYHSALLASLYPQQLGGGAKQPGGSLLNSMASGWAANLVGAAKLRGQTAGSNRSSSCSSGSTATSGTPKRCDTSRPLESAQAAATSDSDGHEVARNERETVSDPNEHRAADDNHAHDHEEGADDDHDEHDDDEDDEQSEGFQPKAKRVRLDAKLESPASNSNSNSDEASSSNSEQPTGELRALA